MIGLLVSPDHDDTFQMTLRAVSHRQGSSGPLQTSEGTVMGAGDKASNKIDNAGGKAKEALGKVTGDKSTENEGKVDQAKSSLKDAGEKIKDAFKN